MIDYDRIASDYAQHRQIHPEVIKSLVSTSGLGKRDQALEVGCGTGNYILALERLTGASCWGLDPSEGMLSQARIRLGDVRFLLGGAEHLDFPENYFHLVFSVDVIHHVRDHLAYYKEAYRVLKPGGKLCTVTDSEWIIRHRQPMAVYFPDTVEVELERYPGVTQLRDLMQQAGFGEISEEMVQFPYELGSSRAYRDKAFSALHMISEAAFQKGIEHMEQDLRAGSIACVSRYLLLWGTR